MRDQYLAFWIPYILTLYLFSDLGLRMTINGYQRIFFFFLNLRKAHLLSISCRHSLGSPLQYVCCKELKELHDKEVDFTFQGFSVSGTYVNQINILVSKLLLWKSRKLFALELKGGNYWTLVGQRWIRVNHNSFMIYNSVFLSESMTSNNGINQ